MREIFGRRRKRRGTTQKVGRKKWDEESRMMVLFPLS
jgi:hypothetical protein